MTRWHLLNLPVYFVGQIEPWAVIEAAWFNWHTRQLDVLRVGRDTHGIRVLQFNQEIRIQSDAVWVLNRQCVGHVTRAAIKKWDAEDWQDRIVHDWQSHPQGRLKDVGFDAVSGRIESLWLSRGILTDLWHGMVMIKSEAIAESEQGITLRITGQTSS